MCVLREKRVNTSKPCVRVVPVHVYVAQSEAPCAGYRDGCVVVSKEMRTLGYLKRVIIKYCKGV